MEARKLTGAALAAVAATLFIVGCNSMGTSATKTADAGSVKVKCYGANACKGQAECKTAMNSCKGHNSCKGKGFVMMDEGACIDRLGRA